MIYGPFTFTDILKMMWWTFRHPPPPVTFEPQSEAQRQSVAAVRAELSRSPVNPMLVRPTFDHSYRQVRPVATTAILCEIPGQKATLHEDHYPLEEPGKGFDSAPGTKLTRVNVLLVE